MAETSVGRQFLGDHRRHLTLLLQVPLEPFFNCAVSRLLQALCSPTCSKTLYLGDLLDAACPEMGSQWVPQQQRAGSE